MLDGFHQDIPFPDNLHTAKIKFRFLSVFQDNRGKYPSSRNGNTAEIIHDIYLDRRVVDLHDAASQQTGFDLMVRHHIGAVIIVGIFYNLNVAEIKFHLMTRLQRFGSDDQTLRDRDDPETTVQMVFDPVILYFLDESSHFDRIDHIIH